MLEHAFQFFFGRRASQLFTHQCRWCVISGLFHSAKTRYFWKPEHNCDEKPHKINFIATDSVSGNELEALPSIPYELTSNDEKFLQEAMKLTGSPLSELDICHHRVIMKLRKSCHELNAEQMGKLAVMLLNCQSNSEGRNLFKCTETMSLKECTQGMDSDTWNAYHLVTNRAKAVCVAIRQDQFRGLTEMTVNKLMQSGKYWHTSPSKRS